MWAQNFATKEVPLFDFYSLHLTEIDPENELEISITIDHDESKIKKVPSFYTRIGHDMSQK